LNGHSNDTLSLNSNLSSTATTTTATVNNLNKLKTQTKSKGKSTVLQTNSATINNDKTNKLTSPSINNNDLFSRPGNLNSSPDSPSISNLKLNEQLASPTNDLSDSFHNDGSFLQVESNNNTNNNINVNIKKRPLTSNDTASNLSNNKIQINSNSTTNINNKRFKQHNNTTSSSSSSSSQQELLFNLDNENIKTNKPYNKVKIENENESLKQNKTGNIFI
jgi:hypothetical protein